MKRPIGRPTKYNETMIDKVREYISTCGREQTELPTLEGLSLYININLDTILEWGKKYPDFSGAIKELKQQQKAQLINDGMYGGKDVNATMAIFLLKVNHDMIETEKRILAGDKNEPLQIEFVDEIKRL